MPKSTSLTIAAVASSTQTKPLVSVNGTLYDPNALRAAIESARQTRPTATYSEEVTAASEPEKPTDTPAG